MPCKIDSKAGQRLRLLAALQTGPVSTIEAREALALLHPAGRVMELRRAGYPIGMVWRIEVDGCGQSHRVGVYHLKPGALP